MSASITPHHAEIGTPSVMRKPSNGPKKFEEKNTMYTDPTIISTPSTRAADHRGMRTPAASSVSPDE